MVRAIGDGGGQTMASNDPWQPRIDHTLCTGCGECIVHCPTGALGWQANNVSLVHPDLCTYCTACEDVCPVGAIELPYLIMKSEPGEEAQDE